MAIDQILSLLNQIGDIPIPAEQEGQDQLHIDHLRSRFDCRVSRWDKKALEKAVPFKYRNLRRG